jgi:hypothetical protein
MTHIWRTRTDALADPSIGGPAPRRDGVSADVVATIARLEADQDSLLDRLFAEQS